MEIKGKVEGDKVLETENSLKKTKKNTTSFYLERNVMPWKSFEQRAAFSRTSYKQTEGFKCKRNSYKANTDLDEKQL